MEINYSSQLGRFTCDKWARLWWVRENKVSPASLASISTPLRFPRANRNTLTYFVSSHKKGILCKIICYSHQPLCVCVCLSLFCMTLTLTLKSYKVAGLFGLPSDDAYAVLQTQYALNAERGTEKYKVHLTPSLYTFIVFPHILYLNDSKTHQSPQWLLPVYSMIISLTHMSILAINRARYWYAMLSLSTK